MRLSISETAELTGVSVRTLHYYDEINLLKPSEITEAGYRFYSKEEISRLQQILFYRELEFSLKDIAQILSQPDYNTDEALKKRRNMLELRKKHIEDLISLVDETIGGNYTMNKKVTSEDYNKMKKQYAAEVEERWGKTPEFSESEKKSASRSDNDNVVMMEQADKIFAEFAAISDKEPSCDEARKLVEKWHNHICEYYFNCTKEILASLGKMYVADERFTENIDRFGDGTAQFMSEAIEAYCAD